MSFRNERKQWMVYAMQRTTRLPNTPGDREVMRSPLISNVGGAMSRNDKRCKVVVALDSQTSRSMYVFGCSHCCFGRDLRDQHLSKCTLSGLTVSTERPDPGVRSDAAKVGTPLRPARISYSSNRSIPSEWRRRNEFP
jgi:hypothetical protein